MEPNQDIQSIDTATASPKELPGVMELIRGAFKTYRAHFWTFFIISILPALVVLVGAGAGFLSVNIFDDVVGVSFGFFVLVIFGIVAWSLSFLMAVALTYAAGVGGEVGVWDAYKVGLVKLRPYAWLLVLTSVIVLGATFALVVPGIILSVAFAFSVFVFLFEDVRGMRALARSRAYVRGYWWAVAGRMIVFTLFVLLIAGGGGALAGFLYGEIIEEVVSSILGALVAPLSFLYIFGMYDAFRRMKPEVATTTEHETKWLRAAGIFGLVGILVIPVIIFLFLPIFL